MASDILCFTEGSGQKFAPRQGWRQLYPLWGSLGLPQTDRACQQHTLELAVLILESGWSPSSLAIHILLDRERLLLWQQPWPWWITVLGYCTPMIIIWIIIMPGLSTFYVPFLCSVLCCCCLVPQLCPTLRNPLDCSLRAGLADGSEDLLWKGGRRPVYEWFLTGCV